MTSVRYQVIARRGLVAVLALATTILMAVPALGGGTPLSADLSDANEVPPSGTGASGTADLTLNQGLGEVCVDISASGLAGQVVAGHIHQAPAGVNGGVVVNLGVNSADYSACISDVDRELIKDIRQNPRNYYINIHTTAVPSGEIRGQLSR